jgi:UDP-sugar transporter A1/2/3
MVVDKSGNGIKVVSLVTLTLQNAVLGLSMRYARTRSGPMFLSSTAVLMSEFAKLITCLFLVYLEHKDRWLYTIHRTVLLQPMDTLKVEFVDYSGAP